MSRTAIVKDTGPSRRDLLGVYLNDHLAGATACSELAKRMARSRRAPGRAHRPGQEPGRPAGRAPGPRREPRHQPALTGR